MVVLPSPSRITMTPLHNLILFAVLFLGVVQGQDDFDLSHVDIEQDCGNRPADVVFVLDESGSIWGPDFTKQIEFVGQVMSVFDVSFNMTHIGVMTFDDTPKLVMNLGDYTDEADINYILSQVPQMRGGTKTYLALEMMREDMFPYYMRPWVPQIAIVITDGESEDMQRTIAEATLAKQQGITIFAIGVGRSIILQELAGIASSPTEEFMFTVDNYDSLSTLQDFIGWRTCQVVTTTTTSTTTTTTTTTPEPTTPPQLIEGCNGQHTVDVMFGLPDQAGIRDTSLALDFVNSVANEMEISPYQIRAGLTPRNCFEVDGIRLRDHGDKQSFMDDVRRRDLALLGTFTDMQLSYLQEIAFSERNGGRPDSVKIAVMIIDNHSVDSEATLNAALLAKESGIDLIVIGVGDAVDQSEIAQIASGEHAYFIDSYDELPALQEDIIHLLCQGSSLGTSDDYYYWK